MKRLRGELGVSVEHDTAARTIKFNNFPTVGVPGMLATSGVLYYEVEILPGEGGIPQFGFACSDFDIDIDTYTGEGVGDYANSWGFDGKRQCRWYDGSSEWSCTWAVGDIIGFAAHVEFGKIAVSKNGSWSDAPNGVVFENEKVKNGVFPVLTAGGYSVRYNFDGTSHGHFKHAPPPEHIWAGAAP